MRNTEELIPHLFRTESSKITTVLLQHFGLDNIVMAEDITSDTFKKALETWPYNGLPENPTAWLYSVAKNKAINLLKRASLFTKIKDTLYNAEKKFDNIDLSDTNIFDSQLKMLFVVCHPVLSTESKIGLALRILCGFGIEEIANAMLSNKETINKRLLRAKQKLKEEKVQIELPNQVEIDKRLEDVLKILYLIFNEGYYSESNDEIIREELCFEAMRLNEMLLKSDITNKPEARALLSLMCFQASRLKSRKGNHGELILYQNQDVLLWNQELISKGSELLYSAAIGNKLSSYHLEASIAYWHTIKEDSPEKWENILQLYNKLLQLSYSPIAALNRTYALYKANGIDEAIIQAEKLRLSNNHYFFILLGELYKGKDINYSIKSFQKALEMTNNITEKTMITKRINELQN